MNKLQKNLKVIVWNIINSRRLPLFLNNKAYKLQTRLIKLRKMLPFLSSNRFHFQGQDKRVIWFGIFKDFW
jgi:hypothetical protein